MIKKLTALCLTAVLLAGFASPAAETEIPEGADNFTVSAGTGETAGEAVEEISVSPSGDSKGDEADSQTGYDVPDPSQEPAAEEIPAEPSDLPDSEDTAEEDDPAASDEETAEEEGDGEDEPSLTDEEGDEETLNSLPLSAVTPGFYKIGSINRGYSLDVSGGSKTDGANIQVHRPNGTDAQIFYLSDNGDGTFAIEAMGSDKVLDCKNSGKTAGTNVQLWTKKDRHRAQTWQIFNDAGYARILNPNSGLVLTVSGNNVCLGANTGNANTRWLLTKLDMSMTSFNVSELTNDYAYTGNAVEPVDDIKVTTSRKADAATTESHPGYYITGGMDIPQMSIGNYGTSCGPGAVAMVISYLRGIKTTPREILNNWPQYAYNLYYLTAAAASYYGVGSVYDNGPQNNHEAADINKAIAALKNGQPVIAYQEGLSIFSMTGRSHFIVLRGVTPDGMIMVNDPNGSFPFYAHDPNTFEYTLFTPAQVAACAKEFYIFSRKSDSAAYSFSNDITLTQGTDYTVSFSNNVEPGVAKAAVTGIGGYRGTVTRTFGIVDKTVSLESGKAYELVSAKYPIRALDVEAGSTAVRANVRTHTRNKTAAQQWYFIQNDDNTWTIKNVGSGLVLDAQSGGVTDRTNIWQYRQNGTDAQKWFIRDGGDGSLIIVNKKSGKCLDIAGGSTANNANIQLYRVQSTAATMEAQRFYPAQAEADPCLDGTYTIHSFADDSLVLDIADGSKVRKAGLVLAPVDEAKEPVFEFLMCGPGVYRITNRESGLVLDVRGGTFANRIPVQQYTWNGTNAQLWKVVQRGNGVISIATALGSGKCIDISGGIIRAGTPLWIYKQQTAEASMRAQLFVLEAAN